MVFILVILPSLIFIAMSLMVNKEKIKNIPGYCYFKFLQVCQKHYSDIALSETEGSSNEDEYISVIDDSKRQNATICDV